MKIFKTKYDIPLFNWIMISEKGFDLTYLKQNRKPLKEKEHKKLYNIYLEILDSLEDANFELLRKFLKWNILLTEFRANLIKQENHKIKNKNYQFNIKDLEKEFREYLEVVDKYYTDFEITEYYFDKTQHKKFKELTGQEFKELNNFNNIKFYDFNQYEFFCRKYEVFYPLTMSDAFVKLFIKQRIIKIKSLIELDIMLSDIFTTYGKYNEYQFIRLRLFDFNKLKTKVKEEISGFKEVAMISSILGISIDSKKITLAEFEGLKQTAKEKNEQIREKQTNG